MSTIGDWTVAAGEDATITFPIQPATNILGWDIGMFVNSRLGGSNLLIQKYLASGYVNTSGIDIISITQGVIKIKINSQDTSNLDPGNYGYQVKRLNSGFVTVLAEGHLILTW